MSREDLAGDPSLAITVDMIRFCRALRDRGLPVTTGACIDAIVALSLVDLTDRQEIYYALRALLTSGPEDSVIFDELFEDLLGAASNGQCKPAFNPQQSSKSSVPPRDQQPLEMPSRAALQPLVESWLNAVNENAAPVQTAGMSDHDSLDRKDLSSFSDEDLAEIERAASFVVKKLAARPSRRWRASRSPSWIDMRRTVRKSLKSGGEPVSLAFKEHKTRKTKLVVLCDVSGSMDIYSRFLLQFIYALQNSFARVESFIFSTSLERITPDLRRLPFAGALEKLSSVRGWSGGTKIGSSIATINRAWPRLVDHRTIVIILSDGWDTDEPQVLVRELSALKRRAGKLIWLNPLLGSPSYEPLTRGMQSALPLVDVFAPAHNLASLRTLAAHLSL